jgi:glycosyltransferase involved in cell wall biosynthesis
MPVKLSVAIITYNHERFIAQALESVLGQRTDFPFEILVADDHSADTTPAIVADFHRRHPDKIVPILRDRNIGAVPNLTETVGACRGEYVALLEGDDYWLDSSKLQRQVDFLEAHPDFAISCHRVRVLDQTCSREDSTFPPRAAGAYSLDDLLADNFIMTCSVVYRRAAAPRLPNNFARFKLGDWPLMALAAQSGRIQLMDDVMATYRVHSGATWSAISQTHRLRETIGMLKALDAQLDFRHSGAIHKTIARFFLDSAQIAQEAKNRAETGRALLSCVRFGGWRLEGGQRRMLLRLLAFTLLGSSYRFFLAKNANRNCL